MEKGEEDRSRKLFFTSGDLHGTCGEGGHPIIPPPAFASSPPPHLFCVILPSLTLIGQLPWQLRLLLRPLPTSSAATLAPGEGDGPHAPRQPPAVLPQWDLGGGGLLPQQ